MLARPASSTASRPRYAPPSGYTPEVVRQRLYEAGAALLALQVTGLRPAGIRSAMPVPLDMIDQDRRPAPPDARQVSEMDQALSWVTLIPEDRLALRLVVNARCLCSPLSGKPIFGFRAIGARLGVSHVTACAWWNDAVGIICGTLNRPLLCRSAAFAGTKGLVPVPVPAPRPTGGTARRRTARELEFAG